MNVESLRDDLRAVAKKYKIPDFLFVYCEDPQGDPSTITINENATNKAAALFRAVRRWIILNIK